MPELPLPDERSVRLAIAERLRELRTLRSVERAIARHRRESERLSGASAIAPATPLPAATDRQGVARG